MKSLKRCEDKQDGYLPPLPTGMPGLSQSSHPLSAAYYSQPQQKGCYSVHTIAKPPKLAHTQIYVDSVKSNVCCSWVNCVQDYCTWLIMVHTVLLTFISWSCLVHSMSSSESQSENWKIFILWNSISFRICNNASCHLTHT